MKLHFALASPFVRKVLACAIIRGIADRIEKVDTNPHASPADLLRDNPLSKVPALVTDDGLALFESDVICEYLDSIGDAPALFPPAGPARWRALRLQALADGIMHAGVQRRMQITLPQDEGRAAYFARQREVTKRAVDVLEQEAETLEGAPTIGTVAVGCALGYLDFRFPDEAWRPGHPKVTAWYEKAAKQAWLTQTAPA